MLQHKRALLISLVALALSTASVFATASHIRTMPNGWRINPAGLQTKMGPFPLGLQLDRSGRWIVAVVRSGMFGAKASLNAFDARSLKVVSSLSLPDTPFAPPVFGAHDRVVYTLDRSKGSIEQIQFDPQTGLLSSLKSIKVPALASQQHSQELTSLSISSDDKTLYIGFEVENLVMAFTPAMPSYALWATHVGNFPHDIVPDAAGKQIFVGDWMQEQVDVLNAMTGNVIDRINVGAQPSGMVMSHDGSTLYVACSGTNAVYIINASSHRVRGTIDVGLYGKALLGSDPTALAISRDDRTLFVADAENNAVMAIGLFPQPHLAGAIPAAALPTGIALSPHGDVLYIINSLGMGRTAADSAPANLDDLFGMGEFDPGTTRAQALAKIRRNPAVYKTAVHDAFNIIGTLQRVDNLSGPSLRAGLASVRSYALYRPALAHAAFALPPVKHVIYIIRENKTYDSILGDDSRGNGDARLTVFGKANTPNAHALADDFVLLDNYHVEEGFSGLGHQWVDSAYVGDALREMEPRAVPVTDDALNEIVGQLRPSSGYIWDNVTSHGLSYRSYGEDIRQFYPGGPFLTAPGLENHFSQLFASAPTPAMKRDGKSDLTRVAAWKKEFDQYQRTDSLPSFEEVWLPRDHTSGDTPGKLTPQALVAENDDALGQLIQTVSRSKYWKDTVIFVTEDDSGQYPDHVDPVRSVGLVAGGYVRRGLVDHTRYSTASILHTMEALLHIPPMNQYDAGAPIMDVFLAHPDLRPWRARPETVDMTAHNPNDNSVAAVESSMLDFSDVDLADPYLARINWYLIKHVPMPSVASSGAEQGEDLAAP